MTRTGFFSRLDTGQVLSWAGLCVNSPLIQFILPLVTTVRLPSNFCMKYNLQIPVYYMNRKIRIELQIELTNILRCNCYQQPLSKYCPGIQVGNTQVTWPECAQVLRKQVTYSGPDSTRVSTFTELVVGFPDVKHYFCSKVHA